MFNENNDKQKEEKEHPRKIKSEVTFKTPSGVIPHTIKNEGPAFHGAPVTSRANNAVDIASFSLSIKHHE